jgi:hypothetical protein
MTAAMRREMSGSEDCKRWRDQNVVLEAARGGTLQLYTSAALLAEVEEVLGMF